MPVKQSTLQKEPTIFASVPQHWTVKKLSYLASLKSGEGITTDAIGEQGLYPVYGGNGLRGYADSYTHEGEYVLIGRQGALCGNINYADGKFWASEHAIVVTPLEDCDIKWLGETLRAMNLNQYSVSAAQPGISIDRISSIKIAVPPIEEQRWLSRFIDRETAEIDALVAGKERMLALLEEKRQALISHIVTRGLDPNAPLKPSGLPWLGDIPQHWTIERAKGLFHEVDERTVTGEEELLSLRMHVGLVPHHDVSDKLLEPKDVVGFKKVETGQLVINRMRASMGLIAIANQSGLVSPDYAVFDIVRPVHMPYFLALFNTPLFGALFRSASKGMGTGSQGFLRLYTDNFLALHFPAPPLEEQKVIMDYLEREWKQASELKEILIQSVDLLKERRAALITAAVTGQISMEDIAV
jgi:type I restriction enzyme, S subunit